MEYLGWRARMWRTKFEPINPAPPVIRASFRVLDELMMIRRPAACALVGDCSALPREPAGLPYPTWAGASPALLVRFRTVGNQVIGKS